jgi:hypothetical protein
LKFRGDAQLRGFHAGVKPGGGFFIRFLRFRRG